MDIKEDRSLYGEPVTHEVRNVVCDYGVYAKYKHPEPHEELVVICNCRKNAELIKDILDKDSRYEVGNNCMLDDEVDVANGNILGYLDDLYHPKVISFDSDGVDTFCVTLSGLGRISKPDERESIAILKMKATSQVVINRKIGPIPLWTIVYQ